MGGRLGGEQQVVGRAAAVMSRRAAAAAYVPPLLACCWPLPTAVLFAQPALQAVESMSQRGSSMRVAASGSSIGGGGGGGGSEFASAPASPYSTGRLVELKELGAVQEL